MDGQQRAASVILGLDLKRVDRPLAVVTRHRNSRNRHVAASAALRIPALAGVALDGRAYVRLRLLLPHHVQHVARVGGVQLEPDLAPNEPVVSVYGTLQTEAAQVLIPQHGMPGMLAAVSLDRPHLSASREEVQEVAVPGKA